MARRGLTKPVRKNPSDRSCRTAAVAACSSRFRKPSRALARVLTPTCYQLTRRDPSHLLVLPLHQRYLTTYRDALGDVLVPTMQGHRRMLARRVQDSILWWHNGSLTDEPTKSDSMTMMVIGQFVQ